MRAYEDTPEAALAMYSTVHESQPAQETPAHLAACQPHEHNNYVAQHNMHNPCRLCFPVMLATA